MNTKGFLYLGLLIVALIVAACGSKATPEPPTDTPVIPLSSTEPSQEAIVTATVLPTESSSFSNAYQERLAYLGPDRNLWIVNADGSEQKRLTEFDEGVDGSFEWSLDGQKIAFNTSEHDGTESIYVYDLKGDHLVQLVGGRETVITSTPLTWSPNGRQLAFAAKRNNERVLCVVNSDGSGLRELSRFDSHLYIRWFPDNVHIAFKNDKYLGGTRLTEVYIADVSDGTSKRIYQGYGVGGLLAIYGGRIVFSGSNHPYTSNLYVADPTTGDSLPVFPDAFTEYHKIEQPSISFSPDGNRMALWTFSCLETKPHAENRLYIIDLRSGHMELAWTYEMHGEGDTAYGDGWLSDGDNILCSIYAIETEGYAGIYAINLTTGQAIPLAGSFGSAKKSVNGLASASLVSVFGNTILLEGAPEGQLAQLYLVQADGTGLTMVARGYFLVGHWFRGWSSTGKMALEAREVGEGEEVRNIYIIGQDSQVLWKVSNGRNPIWQPSPLPQ